jgi:hypothetical protein
MFSKIKALKHPGIKKLQMMKGMMKKGEWKGTLSLKDFSKTFSS